MECLNDFYELELAASKYKVPKTTVDALTELANKRNTQASLSMGKGLFVHVENKGAQENKSNVFGATERIPQGLSTLEWGSDWTLELVLMGTQI